MFELTILKLWRNQPLFTRCLSCITLSAWFNERPRRLSFKYLSLLNFWSLQAQITLVTLPGGGVNFSKFKKFLQSQSGRIVEIVLRVKPMVPRFQIVCKRKKKWWRKGCGKISPPASTSLNRRRALKKNVSECFLRTLPRPPSPSC